MSISLIGVSMPKKLSFKGFEESMRIRDSIDENTKAVKKLADSTALIAYTLYAIEKSKTASNGYHTDCFAKTSSPSEMIKYANTNWEKPRY